MAIMMDKKIQVPFADLRRNYETIRTDLHKAACRVIDNAHFIGGEEVKGFESEMAKWLDVPEVCSVGCATSGLLLCLWAKGIGAGDEVITTAHTAIPTSEAITLSGAKVVFCDILGNGGYNIDHTKIEQLITPRTKAIIPVHLYGTPAEMDTILAIARKHNLFVIEDCAQAQGARYKNQAVGTMGDCGVYSFFPSKNLGGFGDGGAVIARDAKLLRKIRMLANHGREKKYSHEYEGTNSRLDAIQAAMLRVTLPLLDNWNEKRRELANLYCELLSNVEEVILPHIETEATPVYHIFPIVVPDRESLAAYLKQQGIETGVHYPESLNLQPAYAYLKLGPGSFPNAEYACHHELSLPMFPALTKEEVRYVCRQIADFYHR